MVILVEEVDGYEVFVVEDGVLVVCFDDDVSFVFVCSIVECELFCVVFCDLGFVLDVDCINVEQIFVEVLFSIDVKVIQLDENLV